VESKVRRRGTRSNSRASFREETFSRKENGVFFLIGARPSRASRDMLMLRARSLTLFVFDSVRFIFIG